MHAKFIGIVLVLLTAFLLIPSTGLTQFPGGGKKGGGTKGGGPGGTGGGGMGMGDPNRIFDFLAKDRPYFLLTDTRQLREPLTQWAAQKGITNGQITREQFAAFNQERGGLKPPTGPTSGGGPPMPPGPGGSAPTGSPTENSAELMAKAAEFEFKRRDINGDGFLNRDEMNGKLRDNLDQWDKDRDGLIDLTEYKAYFIQSNQDRAEKDSQKNNSVTIIIEDELEKRPVVFRAGKIPKEVEINGTKSRFPPWFEELDLDKDGQVSLYEWRKAGKDLNDFNDVDRNGDGLITVEEVIGQQRTLLAKNSTPKGDPLTIAVSQPPSFGKGAGQFPNIGGGGQFPNIGGDKGKGKGGFGGGTFPGGGGKSKKSKGN